MSTNLGAFLRARRAAVRPADVGLPSSGPRRVPGLRREEVALLAGVSVDYLTRLEQGREKNPSPALLNSLARTLRLDHDAAAHLFGLAGLAPAARRPAPPVVDESLAGLLESWPTTPAFVIDPRMDVLVCNAMGRALFSDFAHVDNLVRMTFLDPVGRRFFVDWDRAAEACVANLRNALGTAPADDGVLRLVTELLDADDDFRRLWARHDVRGKTQDAKTFRHSAVGELTVGYTAFDVRGAPGQQLVTYHAAPGTVDADSLAMLGTLAATSH
ncbi:helix-turn-helix domain-containing protein [Sanguibacter suaedae]|uniref:Helix-turn-helix domain-containing protein n=1 Tax=Sanguibacter suaedae TaxID=2795737 RepID=A0A934I9N1_9MICO|nr:helix-turn-helix transcriptional regulator [Sanguibacter suaedae]MBI9113775.1 helix-turn-helix domain-containing protein [Sanguibacter suaedae]